MSFAPVLRLVLIRLEDAHRDPATIAAIGAAAHETFPKIPGVTTFDIQTPARGSADWDLALLVGFADLGDVEPYRIHDTHVGFVEEHLKPVMASIQAVDHVRAGEPPAATEAS